MYRVEVSYEGTRGATKNRLTEKRLHVGLVTLSSNGEITGYPAGAHPNLLKPAASEPLRFPLNGGSFFAMPPVRADDVFVAIGTQDQRDWSSLGTRAKTATAVPPPHSGLETGLKHWTVSKVAVRLVDPATVDASTGVGQ